MPRLKKLELYVRSMGKLLKVEAVFKDTSWGTEHANALMAKHSELAVVAATEGLILLADKHDQGSKEATG
jgi:hypothetical protein